MALLAAVTGCTGYVSGGYGGAAVVAEPNVYLYGGSYDHGRDVYVYSHRGYQSRTVVHTSGHGYHSRTVVVHH